VKFNDLVETTNKMQPCNGIYYSNVYWRLSMFRAAHCSSSGALNCICSLWFIYTCGDRPLSSLSGKWISHSDSDNYYISVYVIVEADNTHGFKLAWNVSLLLPWIAPAASTFHMYVPQHSTPYWTIYSANIFVGETRIIKHVFRLITLRWTTLWQR
jgi:hypothetical protein